MQQIGEASPLATRLRRGEILAVLLLCGAASLAAIGWSWRNHALLNYGDAIGHLHIARRVLDSRFPGITELGSVWLPLPHLLMLPFAQVYGWWANGIAGTIPSAAAYVLACMGLYRLARHWLRPPAAALTLFVFALNPNLLYLQTTAMTEPLFVCETIWIVLGLVEWNQALDGGDHARASRLQGWIAAALVAAVFTRYDGWIITLVAWTAMGTMLLRRGRLRRGCPEAASFWMASAAIIAAPLAWLAYNAAAFGDWLDFARGPYSAHAIELRTAAHGPGPLHPGWHNPWVAMVFYLKAAAMDATAAWDKTLLALSALGTAGGLAMARRRAFQWALLLWVPVPFYAWSVAYGSVPIFVPVWWPHSYYNTRYGMELLPAFALGLGFVAAFALGAVRDFKARWTGYATGALLALAAWNAWALARARPLVYVEGTMNLHARLPYDRNIPPALRAALSHCAGGAVLMDTSVYPELVAMTGIPLRQTVNESDRQIYRDALTAPAAHAAVVLAFDGDPIAQAVKAHPQGLRAVARFTAKGQPSGTLYVSTACGGG